MIRRCRLCAEDDVLIPQLTLDGSSAFGEPFTLSRCEECGAWQVDPPLSLDFIHSYFQAPERWRISHDPEGRPVDPAERAAARQGEYTKYASALINSLEEVGRVVDIGAGAGVMLSLLPDSFQRIAVEPHPDAAEAASRLGLTVMREWAENIDFPSESLTCLIMNQTFDHLRDPSGFLARAVHWLKPGGLLLLTGLINPDGLMPRLYGPGFRLWHPLYQIYPPPGAMVMVLGSHGFEVLRWWQPYFGTPYGSLKQLLLNIPEVLCRMMGKGRGQLSPAWPGNTYSLLARKTLLLQPLKDPARQGQGRALDPRMLAHPSSG
ncbi:hypothetical protein C4J81_09435 [Deltaproteobacteria bacterium Smac51]|nr:hypothetical protein C4J81_09435 [Deltaproteobacteria bacterium Smac51]